jgi:small-conductance mechanosensitive channel
MIRTPVALLLFVVLAALPAWGQAPATPVAAPPPASQEALPAATATAAPPASEAPEAPQGKPAAAPAPAPALVPNSLGARIVISVSDFIDTMDEKLLDAFHSAKSLPSLVEWFRVQFTDPLARAQLLDTLWRLAAVIGAGILSERATVRLLRRPSLALIARARLVMAGTGAAKPPPMAAPPEPKGKPARRPRRHLLSVQQVRRLPLVIAYIALALMPMVAFMVIAYAIGESPAGGLPKTRVTVLEAADAYAAYRAIMILVRGVLAPLHPSLRLVRLSTPSAKYGVTWLRRIAFVVIFGFAAAEAAEEFGLSPAAYDAFVKTFMLVVHICVLIVILQCRRTVRGWIRGPKDATGPFSIIRRRFAAAWHWVAMFYVAALWIVWAAEIPHGFARLVRVFVLTAAVLVVARLLAIAALGGIERMVQSRSSLEDEAAESMSRLRVYEPVARATVNLLIMMVAVVTLAQAWGLPAWHWLLADQLGHQAASAFITIGITVLAAFAVWEAANFWMNKHIAQLTSEMQLARLARVRTLMPMLRAALAFAILTVVVLMVLSEIGINIAPLLAGAGVLGIAIGFGSQKLVQDVITGLFLLLENAMQVGDVVTLAGQSGTVEYLSVRTIRLRAEDGSVHVIPFSAVSTVTNQTRDYSYAVIEVAVGYRDDYDRVVEVLRGIAAAMRSEPEWEGEIREDIDIWGLNKFTDGGMFIKCRLRCGPFSRWRVRREFNRRMKAAFEAADLYITRQPFADDPNNPALRAVPKIVPLPEEETHV